MPYKVVNIVDDDDDDDDDAYSMAPDSDDRDIEVYAKAVAEFKVTWQRQRKEKEKKFLKAAQAELDAHVDRKKGEIERIMNDMEETYQEFLLKYAVLEDKKREVIVKMHDAQKTLVALSVRKHQDTVELTESREEGALEGIKQFKQTCQDLAGMVDTFMKVDTA